MKKGRFSYMLYFFFILRIRLIDYVNRKRIAKSLWKSTTKLIRRTYSVNSESNKHLLNILNPNIIIYSTGCNRLYFFVSCIVN
jgi:hypothetical protein